MCQRRVIAQLAGLVPRDLVRLADRGEDFGLLDGVNAQVSFEIEIQIEHVDGIAGFFCDQSEHFLFDSIALLCGWHGRRFGFRR